MDLWLSRPARKSDPITLKPLLMFFCNKSPLELGEFYAICAFEANYLRYLLHRNTADIGE